MIILQLSEPSFRFDLIGKQVNAPRVSSSACVPLETSNTANGPAHFQTERAERAKTDFVTGAERGQFCRRGTAQAAFGCARHCGGAYRNSRGARYHHC